MGSTPKPFPQKQAHGKRMRSTLRAQTAGICRTAQTLSSTDISRPACRRRGSEPLRRGLLWQARFSNGIFARDALPFHPRNPHDVRPVFRTFAPLYPVSGIFPILAIQCRRAFLWQIGIAGCVPETPPMATLLKPLRRAVQRCGTDVRNGAWGAETTKLSVKAEWLFSMKSGNYQF